MKYTQKYEFRELMTYVVLWTVLFVAPLVTLYVHAVNEEHEIFSWHEILMIWKPLLLFFALFLVHNYLVAPLLVYRRKTVAYIVTVAMMTACLVAYQCASRPPEPEPHWQEKMEHRQPGPPGEPPVGFLQHDVIAVTIFILMIGMNIGVKLYFKSTYDNRKLLKLKQKNLEQQLLYLKYQINPHFYMNTLNNIHALVDIDPDKAKEMIVVLSKIMRYVLYDGDRQVIPLSREVAFIDNFIQLMRLRYPEDVAITYNAQNLAEGEIPPLMLMTFVENAFKHGVSYQHPSFIDISIAEEKGILCFHCRNSKHQEQKQQEAGGVGLANIKQRLSLIYGEDYKLDIDDRENEYEVTLVLPMMNKL